MEMLLKDAENLKTVTDVANFFPGQLSLGNLTLINVGS